MSFNRIALRNADGNTVSLFNTLQGVEFIHLNRRTEALLTANHCAGRLHVGYCGHCACSLYLRHSDSIHRRARRQHVRLWIRTFKPTDRKHSSAHHRYRVCHGTAVESAGIAIGDLPYFVLQDGPLALVNLTFDLTSVSFASPVVEPLMDGRIASVDPAGNSFTIALAGGQGEPGASRDGRTLTMKTSSGTLYQGRSGLSRCEAGIGGRSCEGAFDRLRHERDRI
jgi:hypothetical protein